MIAHEFFDALPIHQFQFTSEGWKELVVDAVGDELVLGLYKKETPAVTAFNLANPTVCAKLGEIRDWSPESGSYISEIAKSFSNDSPGSLLVIDYGDDNPRKQTLRAIKNHMFVNPLENPGECDLTADVDFSYLSKCVHGFNDIKSSKMITQQQFLNRMGAEIRINILLKNCKSKAEEKKLVDSYLRISSPDQMGSIYKFWNMSHNTLFASPDEQLYPFF